MKKWIAPVLTVLMLTACGGPTAAVPEIDLEDFYESLEEAYRWNEGYMVEIEEDMLESFYPGLRDLRPEQLVAYMPIMSAVVNELVFLECRTEKDAANAAAILQGRIDLQAEGGAWYPESMFIWSRGIVIRQGTYVAMVASAEHQDEIAAAFDRLFQ